jgi:hypothetical protein
VLPAFRDVFDKKNKHRRSVVTLIIAAVLTIWPLELILHSAEDFA